MGSHISGTDLTDPYDTPAASLVQATMTGVFVALPDFITSRLLRAGVATVFGIGGGALLGHFAGYQGNPDEDPMVTFDRWRQAIGDIGHTGGPESDTPAGALDLDSPVRTWLFIGAALLVVILLLRVDAVTRRWLARKLRDRGVGYPNTVLGVISFAVVLLVAEASRRDREVRA